MYIAKKFETPTAGIEDMISIGTIGLIKAVNTFEPTKNIKLATYASRCIENEILMYLRKSSNRRQDASIDEPLNTDTTASSTSARTNHRESTIKITPFPYAMPRRCAVCKIYRFAAVHTRPYSR